MSEIRKDPYLNETNFPIIKNNYVVVSGCSGGGKSSLLSELANRGYLVVHDAGRQIIKEQKIIEGDAMPTMNFEKFLELALSRSLFHFNSQKETDQYIFFDRGIIDSIQLDLKPSESFKRAGEKFRYNRHVFLVPPWEEIFTKDAERKHDFEETQLEFEKHLIAYKHFGYETSIIPKISVQERVDFVLEKLKAPPHADEMNYFVSRAKSLLAWNREKLTSKSQLAIEDLKDLFAPEFLVVVNERRYEANHQNYFEFLNRFRSDIETLDYQVQEYLNTGSTVIMPLTATVKRVQGRQDVFDAVMLIKFNEAGKIVHWQEVYSVR